MQSGALICEKMGKVNGRKRIKQVDVSGNIRKNFLEDKGDCVLMNVVFPCGNTKNVNPMNLMSAVNAYLGTDIVPLNVVRLSLKDENLIDFE